ncbi:UNVERIFIED_CONTAM: hypothetical protein K2H54_032358 [Gekko kuhli]
MLWKRSTRSPESLPDGPERRTQRDGDSPLKGSHFKLTAAGHACGPGEKGKRHSKLCLGPQTLAWLPEARAAQPAASSNPCARSCGAPNAAATRAAFSAAPPQISAPCVNPASTLKQFLRVSFAAATLLGILCANGSPSHRCPDLPNKLRPYHVTSFKPQLENAKKLRIKYEHLRKAQPWQNCSAEHLQTKWELSALKGWDKLEAMEKVLNLSVRVLQNSSKDVADKIIKPVLDILIPLQQDLQACITKKHHSRNETEKLWTFKGKLQEFKAGNLEQSPKCLEAAVGLDTYRLLKTDVRHLLS